MKSLTAEQTAYQHGTFSAQTEKAIESCPYSAAFPDLVAAWTEGFRNGNRYVVASEADLKRGTIFVYGEGWGRATYVFETHGANGDLIARDYHQRHQVYKFEPTDLIAVIG